MYELNHAHKDSEILSALSGIRYPGFSPKVHTNKTHEIGEKSKFAYLDHRRMDKRTSKLEVDMTYVKVDLLENNVIPRLSTIEGCYLDTYKRYIEKTDQIDRIDLDISVLKQVVASHSERLKKAQ